MRALAEDRAGKCDGRVRAGRRGCPEREGSRDGTWAIIREKLAHLLLRNGGLHDGGECETEDQGPEDLPSHGQRHSQCAYDCIDHPPLLRLNLFVQRWRETLRYQMVSGNTRQ